uniref:Uncharacterized protein n=1 Tax=Trichuris muris TaxID=70415 RepID=A0A5S6QTE6_TRIMR
MAVFLLCFFGPKGGPCHAEMSGCVGNLLTVIICFTRLLALLGSIVFLALFFAGAHVHLVCRPLEDVETAKGFVGLLSSTGNKLLHSMLKSSLGISENGTSVPFFNASELTDLINNLSTTSIIRDCKQRKTLFVVLKLNTLNLPVKLANILYAYRITARQDPMHAQVPRIEKGNSSLLATSIQSSNRLSPGNDELYLTPLNPKECANSKDMLKNCLVGAHPYFHTSLFALDAAATNFV